MNTALPTAILEDFRKLSPIEQIDVVEAALKVLRDAWLRSPNQDHTLRQQQLSTAAAALRNDYLADPELTAFASLDGEDFYV